MNVANMSSLYVAYVLSQIIGLLSIILSFFWIITYNDGLGFEELPLFNWHPILLIFGMVFLLGNGLMIFRVCRDSSRKRLKFVHFAFNASGLVCTLLGAVAVITFKEQTGGLQFFSAHSWIGFLGILLYLIQAVISVVALLFDLVSNETRAALIPFHVFLGHLVFVLGIMSIISGFNEAAFLYLLPDYTKVRTWSGVVANFIGLLVAIYGILVVFVTSQPMYRRVISEDRPLLGGNEASY